MADFTRKYDEELTIKKSDRYLPDVPEDVLESAKAKILRAIDHFHCTLPQIKRRGGFEMSEDLTDIFTILEAENVIVRKFNGTLTAFFRPEKVPTKFWHIGNDQLGMDFTPLPEPDRSKVGQVVTVNSGIANQQPIHRWTPEFVKELATLGLSRKESARKIDVAESFLIQKLNYSDDLQLAWDEGRRNYGLGIVQPVAVVEKERQEISLEPPISKAALESPFKPERPKRNGLAKKVEDVAQFSRDIEEVAKKMNMSVRDLNMKMRRDAEFREAYNRGRARYKDFFETKNNKNKEISMQTQPVIRNGNSHSRAFIQINESDVEKYATEAEGRILRDVEAVVAEKLGIGWSTLKTKFSKFPNLKNAFDRGREQYRLKNLLNEPSQLEEAIKEFEAENVAPEDMKIGIDLGRGESFTETFEAEMLPSEAELDRKFDEVIEEAIKVPEPVFQDEKVNIENKTEDKPNIILAGANGSGKQAVIERLQNNPQLVNAVVVGSNRHSELLDKIEAKREFETPYFSTQLQSFEPSDVISFGDAGEIKLYADLNLFRMDQESRDFVNELINSLQQFKAKRNAV
ncbi:MAG TPA: hypothetical protein PKY82_23890 [Pyrinomonadaceae bacterium]|nr:hypothetical protein [Pyrinomonadaceae bacterium]